MLIVPAVAVKVALVAPDETVTVAGTVKSPLLLLRLTTAPPAGAPCERVTVHVEEPPLLRLDGAHATELRTAELASEMLADVEAPL